MASTILDLEGGTVTLALDTQYNYYQVTDTSTNHDGHLVMLAGSSLVFEDSLNAGFSPVATNIDIRIEGTADSLCVIESANDYADHRWMLPVSTVTMNATRCDFRNYSGDFAPTWELQNCDTTIIPYAYCTITEFVNLTGSDEDDDTLREIIGQATNEMNLRLEMDGVVVSQATDAGLRAICLKKSIAGLLTRYRLDGTRSGSANVDGIVTGDNIGQAIQQYTDEAEQMLKAYIKSHLPSDREMTFFSIMNRSE